MGRGTTRQYEQLAQHHRYPAALEDGDMVAVHRAAGDRTLAKDGCWPALDVDKPSNLVEQDHRAIKGRAPMMGFGFFATATKVIAGIEAMHAIKKGQLGCHQGLAVSDADRFYSLATR